MIRKRTGIILLLVVLVCMATGCREEKQVQKNPEATTGTAVTGEEKSLVEKSRQYAEQMVSGLFTQVRNDFTADLANQLPEENLKSSLESVVTGLTSYQGINRVEEGKSDGYDVVTVVLAYENQQGRSIRFVYNEEGHIAGIWFDVALLSGEEPEETEDSQSDDGKEIGNYRTRKVTVGRSPYELQGTLLIPNQAAKAPVVILLGEEDWDKDGSMGTAANTPLKDMAEGLAARGVATLRYNMRKYEYREKVSDNMGIYDSFLQDACYALDQMYNEKEIDSGHIYLAAMGESGDRISSLVKKKAKRLSGVVMMGAKPVKIQEKYYGSPEKDVELDASYFMEENSTIPLFVLQGNEDSETTKKDYDQWKELWKGRSHITYREYEKLNHYFMPTTGKSDAGDYNRENHVSSGVISEIAKWCWQQTTK